MLPATAEAGDSLLRPAYGLIGVAPIAVVALILLLTGRLNPAPAPGPTPVAT